jgi:DNA-binding FrmR family transcriptional regulator
MASEQVKKDILHRAKIIEGHIRKVVSMIEADAYCIDTLNQSLAVQNALNKMDEVILENHLKTCVTEKIQNGQADEATKEVLEVFKKRRN